MTPLTFTIPRGYKATTFGAPERFKPGGITDNRHQWAAKELQRLFPNGDHEHIMQIMGVHKNINPWVNFKPRELKRTYS